MGEQNSRRGRPLTIEDFQFLGELDGGVREYETTVSLNRRKVTLVLYPSSDPASVERCLAYANRLVDGFEEVKSKIDAYLSKQVLSAWNRTASDGRQRSAATLLKDAKLDSIYLHANGERSFAFLTQKAFDGHAIVLRATARNRITDFDTPG